MKILLVHQDLFFRGGQRVTAQLANGLVKRGHTVTVVVSKVHDDIQRDHSCKKPFKLESNIAFLILPFRRALWNVFPLAQLISKIKPDVIIANAGHYNECAVFALKLLFSKIPVVYVEHNLLSASVPKRFQYVLKNNAKIVAVSKSVKEILACGCPSISDKIVQIYNPILFSREPTSKDILPMLVNKKEFTFVSAGALVFEKGWCQLIKTFSKFKKGGQEGVLIIFGEGDKRSELEALIMELGLEKSVFLPGNTDNLIGNFSKADAFISSSFSETFGMTIIEAMSVNLPIIAIDCPVGPREILEGGIYGCLVKMWDEQQMIDAMNRVYKGEKWEKKNLEVFKVDNVVDVYEKLLYSIL